MPKLKFDVGEVQPEESRAVGTFEAPQPGMYRFQISAVSVSATKGDDGKPDPSKPYVEVVFKCDNSKYKGAQVWGYFIQPGHPSYDKKAMAKWDQLLLAVGISDKKRSGTIDTDKQMVGKFVTVRVRGGRTQSDEYRAEYGSVFPDGYAGTIGDEDGDALADDEGLIDEESESEFVEETDWEERLTELKAASADDLKTLAKNYEIKFNGMTKATLADAIVEYEKANSAESGNGELLDDDVVIDGEVLTREQLAAMDNTELAAKAKEFDIAVRGMRKTAVVDAILAAQEPF